MIPTRIHISSDVTIIVNLPPNLAGYGCVSLCGLRLRRPAFPFTPLSLRPVCLSTVMGLILRLRRNWIMLRRRPELVNVAARTKLVTACYAFRKVPHNALVLRQSTLILMSLSSLSSHPAIPRSRSPGLFTRNIDITCGS